MPERSRAPQTAKDPKTQKILDNHHHLMEVLKRIRKGLDYDEITRRLDELQEVLASHFRHEEDEEGQSGTHRRLGGAGHLQSTATGGGISQVSSNRATASTAVSCRNTPVPGGGNRTRVRVDNASGQAHGVMA